MIIGGKEEEGIEIKVKMLGILIVEEVIEKKRKEEDIVEEIGEVEGEKEEERDIVEVIEKKIENVLGNECMRWEKNKKRKKDKVV